jgi:hypoxanthine phosphoribosyltransferase
MDLLRINWKTAIGYCDELATRIESKPDIIVGISRGGLVPARILSDILDVKDVAVLGIRFYKGMGKTEEKPVITQDISVDIKGKKLLVVDDVADSGRSLVFAREHLKDAKEVRCATLHYKPVSEYKPDYFVSTTTAWIVYPWEVHEVERELTSA